MSENRLLFACVVLLSFVLSLCSSRARFPASYHNRHTSSLRQTQKGSPSPPPYKEFYFDQNVDHFNAQINATFAARYLVCDSFWKNDSDAPIFFYTGNEGDITMFYANTGFVFEISPAFSALIVFAEHRYYGNSLPFGNESFTTPNLQYLSAEQALADYATLIPHLRAVYSINGPLIAFGGSYGGMLSAWFRLKYGHLVAGSIAASAPVAHFLGLTDPYAFNKIVTDSYNAAGCGAPLRKSIARLLELYQNSTRQQVAELSSIFKVCPNGSSPGLQSPSDVQLLYNFVNTGLTYMAMTDYPSASSFLTPMPPWPVNVACKLALSVPGPDPYALQALAAAIGVYYNYTGSVACFNVTDSNPSPQLGEVSWDYQSCTEMLLDVASNGVSDFFWPQPWNETEQTASCLGKYGTTPSSTWVPLYFGGRDMPYPSASEIVFSNGLLDPWSVGGVLNSSNPDITILLIADSAHHTDLRFSDPNDPPSVVAARRAEVDAIQRWTGIIPKKSLLDFLYKN